MNNNNPSRFLCEFDTVDTIAMRNVAEKRKLQEHLDVLERELHNNLVKIESKMLSIRLENSDTRTRKKKAKFPADNGPSLDIKGGKKAPPRMAKQVNSEANNESEMGSSRGLHNVSWPRGISLPKITTSSFLSAEHGFNFGKESRRPHQETRLLDRARSLETISELNQKQLYAEKRILSPLHRARSVNSDSGRPPTPQVHSLSQLTPAHAHCEHRRGSWDSRIKSNALLAPLPDGYSPNARMQRVHSAPDIADIVALNRSRGTIPPKGTQGDKQGPKGIPLISKNGVQNIDDIVKTRLQLFKDGVPDEDEMKKIRYLRRKGETADEEMESISFTFDKTL